ncbi:hypothetical protein PACTADRAFT_75514 [Pachysolen tannophilus NRRL Y-2460]|uniref:Peptide N-acetyl-beta-D-glucosaminyl asparaginase amidase A N-terminal domain-containing protein n=1 Tax=Pachysolen tannophilus NRRL Y-2460 TaxID=669874 RepID=A0A1E4TX85_PACTA|nr:hypothetical protein PACTADRAFT_75514 [Pachysolen tannophilus NRRL Y-2460]
MQKGEIRLEDEVYDFKPKHRGLPVWFKSFLTLVTYFTLISFCQPLRNVLPQQVVEFTDSFNPMMLLASTGAGSSVDAVPTQVFEVKPNVIISASSYVVSSNLLNETALIPENSDIVVDYSAPEIFNFTGASLGLNFSTEGTQEPIVAEIYVDEHPIWRTSTPNPLGAEANSSIVKNITDFLSLFTKDRSIYFKIIDGEITGNVNVSINATFYNDTSSVSSIDPTTPIDIASIFEAQGPADIVIPLSNKGRPFQLPKDKFSVLVPQLAQNVTVAKLALFASANEDETRWFSNPISNIPETADAIGPIRILNVYVDSIFITSIAPNPVLLTANKIGDKVDAAPAWSPIAAPGAFDALSYQVDLLSVLPLFWSGATTIDIEVVSPVKTSTIGLPPSPEKPVSPPGVDQIPTSKWDLSANLLAWQSDSVNSSIGDLFSANSSVQGTGILIAPPKGGLKNQIVRSTISSNLSSQLNFTLVDGTTHNLTAVFNSSNKAISILNSKLAGASNSLTSIGTSKTNIEISDLSDPLAKPLFEYKLKYAYPLIIKEVEKTTIPFGPKLSSSLNISTSISINEKINAVSTILESRKFNASIDDTSVLTDADVKELGTNLPTPFSRKVEAQDGSVVKDSADPSLDIETNDEDVVVNDNAFELIEQLEILSQAAMDEFW